MISSIYSHKISRLSCAFTQTRIYTFVLSDTRVQHYYPYRFHLPPPTYITRSTQPQGSFKLFMTSNEAQGFYLHLMGLSVSILIIGQDCIVVIKWNWCRIKETNIVSTIRISQLKTNYGGCDIWLFAKYAKLWCFRKQYLYMYILHIPTGKHLVPIWASYFTSFSI